MKSLRKLLPLLLLILTINCIGQKSSIVSDDEYYLTSNFSKPYVSSTYDVTVSDGYSKSYSYDFRFGNDDLIVFDDGSSLNIDQGDSEGLISVNYNKIEQEVLTDSGDVANGDYVMEITSYTSSNSKFNKVVIVKDYWTLSPENFTTTYTVIMSDNKVYTFLK